MFEKGLKSAFIVSLALSAASTVWAQAEDTRHERRPAASQEANAAAEPKHPNYDYFSILNGTPKGMWLHHDTEVGTGKPIDVYQYAIELQVMNSDGNLEPQGLIIDNFFTATAISPITAPNPYNARDCRKWNALVVNEEQHQNPNSPTWSYVEFSVAEGARQIQTNEDGQVFWSDDIECWGSRDRFSPF